MAKETNVYEIVRGIHQAAFNAGDHVKNKDIAPVGLKREEGHPIVDSRVPDGFSVGVVGNTLKINYHGIVKPEEVYNKKFEEETENMVEKIASWLKKEFKNVVGKTLSITPIKKSFKAIVQSTSKVRTWVQATKLYTINGTDFETSDDDVEKKFKKQFVDFYKVSSDKRPENKTKEAEKNTKEEQEK